MSGNSQMLLGATLGATGKSEKELPPNGSDRHQSEKRQGRPQDDPPLRRKRVVPGSFLQGWEMVAVQVPAGGELLLLV